MIRSVVCRSIGIWQVGQYGLPQTSEQHTQIVVDLRSTVPTGTRRVADSLLLDGDG